MDIINTKKADEKKYNKLKKEIFTPLSQPSNIVRVAEIDNMSFLYFDPLEKHNSNYFKKAEKYLKKIKKFPSRFSEIEQKVNTFNEHLNNEYENTISTVSEYLKDKGFEISTDTSIPTKENTVLIKYLLPALNLFWRCKQFDHIQEQIVDENGKKELRIRGTLIIIVSDKNKEKDIRECIECLKHNQTINEKYDNILAESEGIMKEAEDLSNEIKKKLVDVL